MITGLVWGNGRKGEKKEIDVKKNVYKKTDERARIYQPSDATIRLKEVWNSSCNVC